MPRREIVNLPGDILESAMQPALNSNLGCLIYFVGISAICAGIVLEVGSYMGNFDQAEKTPYIPTPSCLMDGRPAPSERIYSARTPDGGLASLVPIATVFDAKTCPPSSR